jgi:hypothetical protein
VLRYNTLFLLLLEQLPQLGSHWRMEPPRASPYIFRPWGEIIKRAHVDKHKFRMHFILKSIHYIA